MRNAGWIGNIIYATVLWVCLFFFSVITNWNQDCQEKHQQPQICRWYRSNGSKPLDESEREWKSWLKIQYSKTKVMAFGSVTSWQMDQEKVEIVTDFIFWGSQITADGDCSHEIKRHLLLGRKVITNLDSILKSRDITLLPKVLVIKAMVFPVVRHRCESWTIKKAEHWRIDAFKLWCWRRLLRVPRTARRSD